MAPVSRAHAAVIVERPRVPPEFRNNDPVLQLAAAPAPPTGEALAELIADGVARSTDLTPFDPMRLQALDPSLLRSS